MSPSLLSRFADHSLWLGRYVERAENIARLIDVTEGFAEDINDLTEWRPLLAIHRDEDAFQSGHEEARSGITVARFYLVDRNNPNSIISSIASARENARAIRHLISTELWTHLNVFYGRLAGMSARKVTPRRLSELSRAIKEQCQLHTGIAEGTLYRDEAWRFLQIGKFLERADQTTRLLDIKYFQLESGNGQVPEFADTSWWNLLLRSAAGYHAFRRVFAHDVQPRHAAEFLLFSSSFSRSVSLSIRHATAHLNGILVNSDHARSQPVREAVDRLNTVALDISPQQVFRTGLHGHIDNVQIAIADLTRALDAFFFE